MERAGQSSDAGAEGSLSINDTLTNELLRDILSRAMIAPGVVATRTALAARRAHLTCSHGDTHFELPGTQRVRNQSAAWRECLARAGLSGAIVDVPLWCRSRRAEAMYGGVCAGLPCMRVCRQWRDLLADSVNSALCGIEDRPPASTEVLVLAWDWDAEPRDPVHLRYLAGLPRLRALLVWNIRQLAPNGVPWSQTSPVGPPALPAPLSALRHLVYFVPSTADSYEDGEALVESLSQLRDLHTLVLPRSLSVPLDVITPVLSALTNLETLWADISPVELRTGRVTHLSSLQHLNTCASAYNDGGNPRAAADAEEDAEDFVQEPLARLTALEALTLTRSEQITGLSAGTLAELSTLSRLTSLTLSDYCCSCTTLAQIAAAPALVVLRLRPCLSFHLAVVSSPADISSPLTAMTQLTELSFGEYEIAAEHAQALGSLTNLRRLQLSASRPVPGKDHAQLRGLSALTSLTRLEIRKATFYAPDSPYSRALTCMLALERLELHACWFCQREVTTLGALTRLQELRLPAVTFARGTHLADLPLLSFPDLRLFEISEDRARPRAQAGSYRSVWDMLLHLTRLEDVSICRFDEATDDVMLGLAGLPELRCLRLRECTGWSAAGVLALGLCPKLLVLDIMHTPFVYSRENSSELPFTVLWCPPEQGYGDYGVELVPAEMLAGLALA